MDDPQTVKTEILTEARIQSALDEISREVERSREELAAEHRKAVNRLATVDRAIERLLDLVEAGQAVGPVRGRLADRERERLSLTEQMEGLGARLRSFDTRPQVDPSCGSISVPVLVAELRAELDSPSGLQLLGQIIARVELNNEGGKVLHALPPSWLAAGLSRYPVGDSDAGAATRLYTAPLSPFPRQRRRCLPPSNQP